MINGCYAIVIRKMCCFYIVKLVSYEDTLVLFVRAFDIRKLNNILLVYVVYSFYTRAEQAQNPKLQFGP